jgi:hypothetical protein
MNVEKKKPMLMPQYQIPCKYGTKCWRKNPGHLEKFSHPHLDRLIIRRTTSNDDHEEKKEENGVPRNPSLPNGTEMMETSLLSNSSFHHFSNSNNNSNTNSNSSSNSNSNSSPTSTNNPLVISIPNPNSNSHIGHPNLGSYYTEGKQSTPVPISPSKDNSRATAYYTGDRRFVDCCLCFFRRGRKRKSKDF